MPADSHETIVITKGELAVLKQELVEAFRRELEAAKIEILRALK